MGYKKDQRKKKHRQKATGAIHERTGRDVALSEKRKHDKAMQGKKTVMVPHPTLPKTWIEKIID